jgi:hypothetical protein
VNDEPTTHDPSTGPRRLAEFASDGPAAATPAVTLSGGPDVVVLRRAETGMVEVCQGHQILTLVDDAEATPITEPAHRDDLIRRALRTVAAQRYAATQQVLQARGERDRQQDAHAAVLRDIRATPSTATSTTRSAGRAWTPSWNASTSTRTSRGCGYGSGSPAPSRSTPKTGPQRSTRSTTTSGST